MITIDDRVGSRHYLNLFKPSGLPVRMKRLPAADIAFRGQGPEGYVAVGIEVKRVDDLVASLMSKRLTAVQLPALAKRYQWVFLVVQGEYRESRDGLVQKPAGNGFWHDSHSRLPWGALEGILVTLRICARVHVVRTRDDRETVRWVSVLYQVMQKPWDRHRSHHAIGAELPLDGWLLRDRTPAEEVACRIPGVGVEKAPRIAAHFTTVEAMASATVGDWRKVKWLDRAGKCRSLGPTGALKAWRWFRKEKG